jgi:hypothetical protein
MFHKFRWSILSAAVILALLVSAFPLGVVMAEGEDPAPAEAPQTEEQSAASEASLSEVEAPPLTVEEVVAQVPEDVVVVPVDPSGQVLPMAEEATGKSLVSGDPVYCPGIAVWGDPSCSGTLTSIDLALDAAKAGPGTIYVAVDYTDLTPDPIVINGLDLWGSPGWINLIGGFDFTTGAVSGSTALTRQVIASNLTEFTIQHFDFPGGVPSLTAAVLPETDGSGHIPDGDVKVFDSNLSDNPGAGLTIDVNGSVNLEDVKINNNGAASTINAGFVNLLNVEAIGNKGDSGLEISSNDVVMIDRSKFNENEGHGLLVDTATDIFISCSQAINNGLISPQVLALVLQGADGMNLTSTNDIMLLCNKLKSNAGYGLFANAGGTIYLASNTISGNGQPDQLFTTPAPSPDITTAPCSYICPACGGSGEEEPSEEGNTQVVIVKVGEGSGSAEIKGGYSTVFKLYEEKEDKERLVQLTALLSGSAPDGSSAVYTPLDESKLPAPLPEGASLIPWGFNLAITNPDGTAVESLIGYMLVRFYLPEGFVLPGGMRLVIQYFDPATSSWTPMSTAVGGGTAYTYASKPGTYVLTMVPIE